MTEFSFHDECPDDASDLVAHEAVTLRAGFAIIGAVSMALWAAIYYGADALARLFL